ncbi:hypothetical protein K435DRAFT_373335 [Dendrothele bispora CBS 962.96]|uniref:Seryl-tRNA synthetase n=1 Tax=Dendrothele bispora (strain CBS 962.96) TaxID=1314807 RepID=A0A4V4HD75_DENBC|nr:hypothetical protein K435DRAFT_373335 [Dendrothele bispora CBS 962.96]
MLNGTLCATERALCCLVENYQTPYGVVIPKVLRPYMQGRDFLPWVKDLPKGLQKKRPEVHANNRQRLPSSLCAEVYSSVFV